MLDNDFDPYEELLMARHNVNELIKGFNHQSQLFRDLSEQHQQLVALNRQFKQRLDQLESEIKALKTA